MRKVTSFTISSDILTEIANGKGESSTSERVNRLLRLALDLERRQELERQAAEFFASETSESLKERAAYQKATKRSLSRD
jgi:hypothetical protein